MRALTNAEILDVWERGCQALPSQRAMLLLTVACPEKEPGELAASSIGRRDALLLELRGMIFGRRILSLTKCQQCGESVEMEFSVDDFTMLSLAGETDSVMFIAEQEYEVQFRLPDTVDQVMIADLPDAETAQQTLMERCVVSAARAGNEVSPGDLPPTVVARMTEKMAELDPLASIFLAVTCAACGNCWQVLFDVCDLFWRELSYYARRLLGEVHQLASAYGWSETEILSLSATRRRLYLEMSSR